MEYQSGVDILEDKEEHVWIFKASASKDKGIKVGDCVSLKERFYLMPEKMVLMI